MVVLALFGALVASCTEGVIDGDAGDDGAVGVDAASVSRDAGSIDAPRADTSVTPRDGGDDAPLADMDGALDDGGLGQDGGMPLPDAWVAPALSCADICHGDRDNPAPPLSVYGETATSSRAVGAHRSHLGASPWHREVTCEDCHIVPTTLRSPGHLDSTPQAELTWSVLATASGATPSFDGTTCSGTYCHGTTLLPGGTITSPIWTTVDGSQSLCGTCHGLPPGGSHPPSMDCSTCHPTVDAARNIVDPARHIDGQVDLSVLSCTTCHGTDGAGPAPPRDTSGASDTTVRGVGAHASHVRPSTWHRDVACSDCHTVPTAVSDVGHNDTPRPAELTWGAIATASGATPVFDGTSCSGAYCHGATLLPGGTNNTPRWTTVDGTQAACGTCHGLPPGGGHPASGACSTCHPTVDAARNIIDPARHIDGTVDTIGLSCTTCHGDAALGPAPPRDTTGGTATTARGVGAHQSHLRTSTWHRDIACTECHVLPATVGDVGHNDTALPAELTFGPLALADGATPGFDGTRCNGAYCHGTTLLPGGTLTTPTWTTVDGTQAACGTCHGLPPGGAHPSSSACSTCHPTVDAARNIIDRTRHIDGTVDVVALTCTSCHGDALTNAAPPVDTTGGSATTLRGVGAHQ
ncbi:MAG: CxxxxCH/CxxCH domain-containing protein, partial [Sandaracinaceae bacterium]|nr:CxxxxCH/CxxCH domain-containing protein [Sandaracinaceae bacterium]